MLWRKIKQEVVGAVGCGVYFKHGGWAGPLRESEEGEVSLLGDFEQGSDRN